VAKRRGDYGRSCDYLRALAGIFLGKITKWNGPQLTKINPEAKLPNHEIVVAFRSDGSGTTYIWTDYLAKVSEEWNNDIGFGTIVPWPVGIAGRGTEVSPPLSNRLHIRLGTLSLLTLPKTSCPAAGCKIRQETS